MSRVLEMLRARSWPRAAALTLMTIGVAACSSDTSRFHESPFGLGSDTTGSVAQGAPQGQPVGRVESRPLAPQAAQAILPPTSPVVKLCSARYDRLFRPIHTPRQGEALEPATQSPREAKARQAL